MCVEQYSDVVRDLLTAGASLAARDDSQQTLLHHAARADPPLAVSTLQLMLMQSAWHLSLAINERAGAQTSKSVHLPYSVMLLIWLCNRIGVVHQVWKLLVDCWQGDNKALSGSSGGSGRQHKGSQKVLLLQVFLRRAGGDWSTI